MLDSEDDEVIICFEIYQYRLYCQIYFRSFASLSLSGLFALVSSHPSSGMLFIVQTGTEGVQHVKSVSIIKHGETSSSTNNHIPSAWLNYCIIYWIMSIFFVISSCRFFQLITGKTHSFMSVHSEGWRFVFHVCSVEISVFEPWDFWCISTKTTFQSRTVWWAQASACVHGVFVVSGGWSCS